MTDNQLMKLKKSELVKMIQERESKVVIVSDGTLKGTKLYRDGQVVNNLTQIGFMAHIQKGVKTWITQNYMTDPDREFNDQEYIVFDQGVN